MSYVSGGGGLADLMKIASGQQIPGSQGGVMPYPQQRYPMDERLPGGGDGQAAMQPKWMQALASYAPFAMLGAAGARAGTGGMAAAAGMAGLIAWAKQHQLAQAKKAQMEELRGGMTTGPTLAQAGIQGMPGTWDSTGSDDTMPDWSADGGSADPMQGQYAQGGVIATVRPVTMAGVRRTIAPRSPGFEANRERLTGKFAKGGLVGGVERKGNQFGGKF